MKLNKLLSSLLAFALLFCAFAFASPSPSSAATNTKVTAEKSAQKDVAVAIGFIDTAKAVAPNAPTNPTNTSTAPPVALPLDTGQITKRPFYGYVISQNTGKIPIKPLNINAVGRFEPDYVSLN